MVTTKKSYSLVTTIPLTINISKNNLESIVVLPFYFILAYTLESLQFFFPLYFEGEFQIVTQVNSALKLAIYGKRFKITNLIMEDVPELASKATTGSSTVILF